MSHAMVFTGYDKRDGERFPNKWRVENRCRVRACCKSPSVLRRDRGVMLSCPVPARSMRRCGKLGLGYMTRSTFSEQVTSNKWSRSPKGGSF